METKKKGKEKNKSEKRERIYKYLERKSRKQKYKFDINFSIQFNSIPDRIGDEQMNGLCAMMMNLKTDVGCEYCDIWIMWCSIERHDGKSQNIEYIFVKWKKEIS